MAGHLSPRRRLLLVATDLLLRSRVVETTRALGYDVAVAETAEAARDALRRDRPALLVLDLQASGLVWQEVVAAAKAAPGGPVPILAYGQHTKPSILRAARRAGCDLAVPRSQLVAELPQLIERLREQLAG